MESAGKNVRTVALAAAGAGREKDANVPNVRSDGAVCREGAGGGWFEKSDRDSAGRASRLPCSPVPQTGSAGSYDSIGGL
jgi:hypothetical protein